MPPGFELRKLYDAARPLIEEQLDLTERIADLRRRATALGFDWSQIKALLKAQRQDEREDGRRVTRLLETDAWVAGEMCRRQPRQTVVPFRDKRRAS